MAGKPGPPRIFVRRHILEVKEDTREWIEETVLPVILQAKTIGAVGESVEGMLSNPALAGLVVAGILGVVSASMGREIGDSVTRWYAGIQGLLDAKTPEEKSAAATDTSNALRELIRLLSPLGPFTPTP